MVNRPSHPPCFPSADVFKGWHIMALRCREASTPCDDCSPQYRHNFLQVEVDVCSEAVGCPTAAIGIPCE